MQLKRKQFSLDITANKATSDAPTISFSFLDVNDKTNATFVDLASAGSYSTKDNQLQISLGIVDKFNTQAFKQATLATARAIRATKSHESINIVLDEISEIIQLFNDKEYYLEQFIFNILNDLYYFDDFKQTKALTDIKTINFVSQSSDLEKSITRAIHLTHGVWTVKDLANNPANVATPTHLANIAKSVAQANSKLTVTVLEQEDIQKLNMNAFLAVSRGSVEQPKFVIMDYRGNSNTQQKPIVLVGKGITFDTGGICIKPGLNMNEMKYDMCGAATVVGVMEAIASLNLETNVVGIFASCENMPSGNAIKPGDIVTTMSGKSVEIENTDAEGRLILCDALTYVEQNYQPEVVIDIATLTGACAVALGCVNSGMYSNNDTLAKELKQAAKRSHDKIWQMPLDDEYMPAITKTLADLNNMATPKGLAGSVTAAMFLSQFTMNYKWAHLDIAGTGWIYGSYTGQDSSAGATGRPFYLLVDFIRNYKFN